MKSFFRVFVIQTFLISFTVCHGDENPAFKYSRQANQHQQDEILEDEVSQEDHDFSKTSHGGHSHGGGGCGHSHGGHSHMDTSHHHDMSQEELRAKRNKLHDSWDPDEDDDQAFSNISSDLWLNALGSTVLISIAPFIILFFVSVENTEEHAGYLRILLSFAAGGLLGDAFLHLIPHAMMHYATSSHSSSDSHSHAHSHGGGSSDEGHSHDNSVGLGVMFGILSFLIVDKSVRFYCSSDSSHGHSHGGGGGSNKKTHLQKEVDPSVCGKSSAKIENEKTDAKSAKKDSNSSEEGSENDIDTEDEQSCSNDLKQRKSAAGKSNDSDPKSCKNEVKSDPKKIKDEPVDEVDVSGYLNLFADFFHNFTDGLAIGAAFVTGTSVGWFTMITVLLHEIPHEIGDYAILVRSGVPSMKAKLLQLLTAVGALSGCVVSLMANGAVENSVTAFITPFTAGGFIYIASVSVIPELLKSPPTGVSVVQSVMEIAALVVGVGMMLLIGQFE